MKNQDITTDCFSNAAIKGYWRMGATVGEIMEITELAKWQVEYLILQFERQEDYTTRILDDEEIAIAV